MANNSWSFTEVGQTSLYDRNPLSFFSERVINHWNMLDQDTVSVKTVNSFKSKLEKERSRMGLFLDRSLLGLEAVSSLERSGRTCELPMTSV